MYRLAITTLPLLILLFYFLQICAEQSFTALQRVYLFSTPMGKLGSNPVIDLGSFSLKAGFAGEAYPVVEFTCEQFPWPVKRGEIVDWNQLEEVWTSGTRLRLGSRLCCLFGCLPRFSFSILFFFYSTISHSSFSSC